MVVSTRLFFVCFVIIIAKIPLHSKKKKDFFCFATDFSYLCTDFVVIRL